MRRITERRIIDLCQPCHPCYEPARQSARQCGILLLILLAFCTPPKQEGTTHRAAAGEAMLAWEPKEAPLYLVGVRMHLDEHLCPLDALRHLLPRFVCRSRRPKCPSCP